MKYIKAAIAIVIMVFIDQFTKHLAVVYLQGSPQGKVIVPGVFRLLYLENRGSAFGLMQNQMPFFTVFTICVLIILAVIYRRLPVTKRMLPLRIITVMIASGALGNFVDRVRQKYVVDFFYFELINFPIFNMADIYVTVSAIVLIILIIFYYKDDDFKSLSLKRGHEDPRQKNKKEEQ